MQRMAILLAGILSTALLVAACAGGAHIRNVDNAALGGTYAPEDVERAIVRAGANRGWRMQPQDPGHVRATLEVRDHRAEIDITYDEESFDIQYRDSQNLDHNPQEGTIHPNYNSWIQNLERDILNEIQLL